MLDGRHDRIKLMLTAFVWGYNVAAARDFLEKAWFSNAANGDATRRSSTSSSFVVAEACERQRADEHSSCAGSCKSYPEVHP